MERKIKKIENKNNNRKEKENRRGKGRKRYGGENKEEKYR